MCFLESGGDFNIGLARGVLEDLNVMKREGASESGTESFRKGFFCGESFSDMRGEFGASGARTDCDFLRGKDFLEKRVWFFLKNLSYTGNFDQVGSDSWRVEATIQHW